MSPEFWLILPEKHKNITQKLLTDDLHFVCWIHYNNYYTLQANSVVQSFYISLAVKCDQMTD